MNGVIEFGYKKYRKVADIYGEITPLMSDLAEMTLFVMAKNFPEQIAESRREIDSLKKSILAKKEIPPIWIQVNALDEFVTVIDGFHRIMAYNELGIVRTNMVLMERVE